MDYFALFFHILLWKIVFYYVFYYEKCFSAMAFLIFFFSVILPIKNGICLKDNQLTTTTATKATKKKKKEISIAQDNLSNNLFIFFFSWDFLAVLSSSCCSGIIVNINWKVNYWHSIKWKEKLRNQNISITAKHDW